MDSNGNRDPENNTKVIICSISGGPKYLIEGTPTQTQQENIDYLRKPSGTKIFIINNIILPFHTNTAPPQPVITIGFGPHCHTPETTTVYLSSSVYQSIQHLFWPAITGYQIILDTIIFDNSLLEENGCELSKLLPLLRNLTLKNDTLISQNQYDNITLNLTYSIKQ